jgi:hypothetical protein
LPGRFIPGYTPVKAFTPTKGSSVRSSTLFIQTQ